MLFKGSLIGFGYIIVGEYASLALALLLLTFMIATRPKITKAYIFLLVGTILSIVAVSLQIIIDQISSFATYLYTRDSFTALLVAFLLIYAFINITLFHYINLLSEKSDKNRSVMVVLYAAILFAYVLGIFYQVFMKRLYYTRADGIDITHFTRYYCIAGIFCAFICAGICLYRRKIISRVVMRGTMFVVGLEVFVLTLQLFIRSSIFTSVTYIIPFVALYQLFHSNPYDETTGCQNLLALESRYMSNMRRGKVFYLAHFSFPQIMDRYTSFNYDVLSVNLAEACRAMERISKKVILYRVNYATFLSILNVSERSDAENYAEQMRDILDEFSKKSQEDINYFLGVCGDSRRFETYGNKWVQSFLSYLRTKYSKDGESGYYFARGIDFRDFDEIYKIEKTLIDIRANMDPDDDRILCYAQPIFSIKNKQFRSAEALMRLEIDGKMIPPDSFIQIAERNKCIHALTVIMMHKVCKAVEELAAEYDFDAVTINCSTADFIDKHFYKEILDIIHSYNIKQNQVRLELTETMMAQNYDAVRHNMDMLHGEGIQLYMDDFGTGYSNLERIVDVPVQTIKFDKSLLYKAIEDSRIEDIISYMIDFFKKNGFVTLVEGVENESQNSYSIAHGFDYIQGYHYAKPGPIENLKKYFNKK